MRNTIAGVSLIFASAVSVMAFAVVDHSTLTGGNENLFILSWFTSFLSGLVFLFLGRDKPENKNINS